MKIIIKKGQDIGKALRELADSIDCEYPETILKSDCNVYLGLGYKNGLSIKDNEEEFVLTDKKLINVRIIDRNEAIKKGERILLLAVNAKINSTEKLKKDIKQAEKNLEKAIEKEFKTVEVWKDKLSKLNAELDERLSQHDFWYQLLCAYENKTLKITWYTSRITTISYGRKVKEVGVCALIEHAGKWIIFKNETPYLKTYDLKPNINFKENDYIIVI